MSGRSSCWWPRASCRCASWASSSWSSPSPRSGSRSTGPTPPRRGRSSRPSQGPGSSPPARSSRSDSCASHVAYRASSTALAVWLGLALIVASVVLISGETPFPGIAAVLPVAGAVLVIVGGVAAPTRSRSAAGQSRRPATWAASRTRSTCGTGPSSSSSPSPSAATSSGVRIALACVAVIVAAVSTELVEQPFRRSGFLAVRSRGSVQLGLTASVAVGVVALIMSGAHRHPHAVDRARPGGRGAGRRARRPAAQLRRRLPPRPSRPRSRARIASTATPRATTTAYLIGDSHAAQWVPALDAYAADQGWRLEVHTKSACSVAPVPAWERKLRRIYDECDDLAHGARTSASGRPSRKSSSWAARVTTSSGTTAASSSHATPGYWQEQLTALLQTLDERAGRVVLLAETPFLNYDPIDCLADEDIANCDPPRSRSWSMPTTRPWKRPQPRPVAPRCCRSTSCSARARTARSVVDDIVVFRDNHHLTATFMEHLAEPIAQPARGARAVPDAESLDGAGRSGGRARRHHHRAASRGLQQPSRLDGRTPARTAPAAQPGLQTAPARTRSPGLGIGRTVGSGALRGGRVPLQ